MLLPIDTLAEIISHNEETEKLEFMGYGQIDENGNAYLEFTHASAYTIVISAEPMSAENAAGADTDSSRDTDPQVMGTTEGVIEETNGNMTLWIILSVLAIVMIGGAVIFAARKKEDKE